MMPRAFDSPSPSSLPVHGVPNLPDAHDWQLVIHSRDRAVTLGVQAVKRLPHAEVVDTFTCLAGWTAGPLRWRGVRLSTLLNELGGARDRWIAVSAPEFCSVLPLAHLPAETLLADALDGRPLPPEHGGPFRLIVPNGICYQSVKWVQRIDVQDSEAGDTAQAIALARLPVPERSGQRGLSDRGRVRSPVVVRTKRAYEAPSPDDGARVLVDRVWPRGMSKERLQVDAWLRDLAPSTALRRWFAHDPSRWDEFSRRYRGELTAPLQHELLDELEARARQGTLTLIYGARDTEHNQAIVLRDVLAEMGESAHHRRRS